MGDGQDSHGQRTFVAAEADQQGFEHLIRVHCETQMQGVFTTVQSTFDNVLACERYVRSVESFVVC